jgi:hypothetical protein
LKTAKQIVNDLLSWDIVINDGESILEAIELPVFFPGFLNHPGRHQRRRFLALL